MDQIANRTLPPGTGYEWTAMSYQENLVGSQMMYVFALAILAGASGAQLRAGGYALAAGALLYLLALRAPALSRENS